MRLRLLPIPFVLILAACGQQTGGPGGAGGPPPVSVAPAVQREVQAIGVSVPAAVEAAFDAGVVAWAPEDREALGA